MKHAKQMSPSKTIEASAHFCLWALLTLATQFAIAQEPVGESWKVVRGDGSPGLSYSSFVTAPSGRLLAAGSSGQLMLSDDNGVNWRYSVITDSNGKALFGDISDMLVVGNTIVATVVKLVDSPSNRANLPFQGQTLILSSGNNGDSWNITPFPVQHATLGSFEFPGIYLPNLFLSPGGELLAYGSTVLSNGGSAFFIGGAIFRQTGNSWEQVKFELGMLNSMSTADGGRLVASGFQTVLDSPDGVSWNGYSLADANMSVGAETLDYETKQGLYGSDITFINNNYVMQTQLFRRSESNPSVFIASTERAIIFSSPNPFDGGRNWTGVDQNRVYPNWLNMGSRVVSVYNGAFSSSNGVAWNSVDSTVKLFSGSYGRNGGQNIVAVGNSDEVWRSPDAGETWTKILDQDPGPDLYVQERLGDLLLARAGDTIWRSLDNGSTWVEGGNIRDQTGRGLTRLRASGDKLYTAQGETAQIATSLDGGLNWEAIAIPSTNNQVLSDVVIGQSGRLIIAPESRGINPPVTDFYTSDDDGQSWQPRTAPLGWTETPKQGLYVGGGRIVYMMNGFASFDPELVTSNDNGVTWQREEPFQVVEGLNHVAGDPTQKVIDLRRLIQTKTGRLIILGSDGEIIYSDDLGLTWLVSANYEAEAEGWLNWDMHDIAESGDRLVVAGSRNDARFSSSKVVFALVSEDDGTTWREVRVPVAQGNTVLFSATAGSDGRVVLGGSNGAVFVSEAPAVDAEQPAEFNVREGDSLTLQVPRPPASGAITLNYRMSPMDARAGSDYVDVMGDLTWADGDLSPKSLTIDTVDDALQEITEDFSVDFGLNAEVIVSFNYRITINDNDGACCPGIEIIADGVLRTAEDGTQSTFGVALARAPTDDVTLDLTADITGEVNFQPTSMTFTTANWNQSQTVQLTGLDDSDRDRNKTTRLTLTPTSADTAYNDLMPVIAYVINMDDEVDELIFGGDAGGFEER